MRSITARLFSLVIVLSMTVDAQAAGPTYRLEVSGLACPFCAYGIEKNLAGLKGVVEVRTDIKDSAVVVTMFEGAVLDEETARIAVQDAGFTLSGFNELPTQDTQ